MSANSPASAAPGGRGGGSGWVRRLGREPVMRFALAGALLFAIHAVVQRARRAPDEPAAAAVSRRIAIGAPVLDRLADGFRAAAQREPSRDELGELLLEFVDEEVLYREALGLRLDRDDPAVRRRLIEKMAVMKRAQELPREPTRAELERWFAERRHHFVEPARLWFEQIFFDARVRRGAVNEDALAALALLPDARPGDPRPGDPSPLPAAVDGMSELQVAHLYGPGFVGSLATLAPGRWQGPLSSSAGVHLVRLQRRQPARDPSFAEVEAAVRADWMTQRSKGYVEAAASLLPGYEITIAAPVRQRLAGAALVAPLLQRAK